MWRLEVLIENSLAVFFDKSLRTLVTLVVGGSKKQRRVGERS